MTCNTEEVKEIQRVDYKVIGRRGEAVGAIKKRRGKKWRKDRER